MRFLFLLIPLSAAAQVLNVTIIDYAGVPERTLAGASQVFTELYRKAGGQVAWTLQTRDWRPDEPTNLGDVSGHIVVRICSKEMAKKLVRKDSVLGYVQPSREGELRRVATVFYHRMEELNAATHDTTAVVLGAALAHEVGHLLLGKGAHSPMGIMRCPWDSEELRAIRRGQLTFDQRQAESIVRAIGTRTSDRRIASNTTPHLK